MPEDIKKRKTIEFDSERRELIEVYASLLEQELGGKFSLPQAVIIAVGRDFKRIMRNKERKEQSQ